MTAPSEHDGLLRFTEEGRTLCLVVRGSRDVGETSFFTENEALLQVGLVVHPAGHVIPRHRHVPVQRRIDETGEVLIVRRGRCAVELFGRQGTALGSVELGSGDIMILSGAPHRLTMLEDTALLEVKQGPYQGPAEKEVF
jgi:cupin fold WbuC family metalloprotein